MVVDLFLVFQFIRKLVTPFNKWPAYKEGVIDDKGNVLIKRKDLTKNAQRKAFGVFDQMILNIKKLLAKVPGGSSRLGTYAAALWLIKEEHRFTHDAILNESVNEDGYFEAASTEFLEWYTDYIKNVEDVNQLDEIFLDEDGPCWDSHKQVGMKKKGNKLVPNCVPKNEDVPANNVGSGNIAGMNGDHMSKAAQKKHKKRTLKTFKALKEKE
jgi:hypothetical protein